MNTGWLNGLPGREVYVFVVKQDWLQEKFQALERCTYDHLLSDIVCQHMKGCCQLQPKQWTRQRWAEA